MKSGLQKYITGFFMSWGMFLALPCPRPAWDESCRREMLLAFPFLGLLSGGLWVLGTALSARLLPVPAAAAVMCVLPWALTGFMHLDGYMDVSDAVLSCRDRERRREILKDPHCGSFAVILLAVLALLQWSFCDSLLLSAGTVLWKTAPLVFVSAAVRAAAAYAVLRFSPMETSQYASLSGREDAKGPLVLAFLFSALPLLFFRSVSAAAAAAAYLLSCAYGRRNLGGMNGDISGFALSVGECAGLLALVLETAR